MVVGGARLQQLLRAGEARYVMSLGGGSYVDAARTGNLARLINHSCSPNCAVQKWEDAATGEVRCLGTGPARPPWISAVAGCPALLMPLLG